ncbi:hypothetical protein HER10_EVM0003683 [Colletotrichum scovillei]|uniref:Uncharacterized protein n=1 Tax=Colletotrichum scovillei TaxID=1209932 RepID=A0A9P7R5L3_9PEZI|nr:uncharacterized protein HER10_EVM0003683 [Colletotrichum scovillei]KAF4781819.1 hypothetical protein HER10_EVM0003683 [Colletotrichum scovillei]KAG7049935.1 hypothetical protein JMJ77_0012693 [Colletotrichum scovillei]KAG7068975.1 hypothetical protein JMJ76_0002655 [Colletotrichum scovillei]KAG7072925.1 hypothetical protein JMJ78_0013910 [Colletotrichum scovillei]
MAEHTQGRFMVIDDTEVESPISILEDEPGEGEVPQSMNTDTLSEQMALSFGERIAALPPHQSLRRRIRKSYHSKNLEVVRWEKKIVGPSDSTPCYQEHTLVIIGKEKAALQAQRIAELSNRLQECEDEKKKLQEFLDKANNEAADTDRKLAVALEKAADAEAELAQRESDHRDAMDDLEQVYHKLSGRIEKIESQHDGYEDAKSKTQPFANSTKVSDESIRAIWAKMQYNINYLSNNVLTGFPSERDLKDGSINDSCFLSSDGINDYTELLQDEDMRPFVVEHYIWKTVVGRFFDLGVDGSWAGSIGMSFITCFEELVAVCDRKQLDPTKLLRCKAEVGEMINRIIGVDHTELSTVTQIEITAFINFIPKRCSDHQAKYEKLQKNMCKIFNDALELRAIFMASQAHFYTSWDYMQVADLPPIHFDDKYMEAEGWEREPLGDGNIVLCNISPALVKVGTADGDSYDSDLLLVKARVVCD